MLFGLYIVPSIILLVSGCALYILLVFVPGLLLYYKTLKGFPVFHGSIVSLIVFGNVFGTSLLIAVAWSLARFGLFNVFAIIGAEWVATLVIVWRGFSFKEFISIIKPRLDWKEIAFIITTFSISLYFLLPAFSLVSRGLLYSGADFSNVSVVANLIVAHSGWPNLSIFYSPYTSQAVFAPGLPLFYALFASLLGTNAAYLPNYFVLVGLTLATFAASTLVSVFAESPVAKYGLPLVWIVGSISSPFLANFMLNYVFTGGTPDGIASIAPFLVALVLMIEILRTQNVPRLGILAFLLATAAVLMFNQLTFAILGLAILSFGIVSIGLKPWRWLIATLGLIVAILVLLSPDYLDIFKAAQISPALSSSSSGFFYSPSMWIGYFETYSVIGLIFALLGLLVLLSSRILARNNARFQHVAAVVSGRSVVALWLTFVLVSILAYSPYGQSLLGVSFQRFLLYLPIILLPLIAITFNILNKVIDKRIVVVTFILFILLGSYVGISANSSQSSSDLQKTNSIFTNQDLAAVTWFTNHANESGVIVTDDNSGGSGSLWVRDFVTFPTYTRDKGLLPVDLHDPPPYNLPAYYANLMFTDPNSTNAAKAFTLLNFTYYYLERNYDAKECQVFSVLPYMKLIYSNSQVDIFQYVPSQNTSFFINAVDYSNASDGVSLLKFDPALNSSALLPLAYNAISSISPGSSFDENFTSYTLRMNSPGEYSLFVNGYVYHTQEFLNVSVNNVYQGSVYFNSTGLVFGSPLKLSLPKGSVTITLTFEGNVGWANPIDYLVLNQL